MCGVEKKLTSFSPNKNSRDGLHYYCKLCWTAKIKEYQKNKPKKVKEKEVIDTRFRLINTTKEDWCKMFSIMKDMGYDLSKNIHQQFIEKHNLPAKKSPAGKPIKSYNPSDCGF
jgi:hypothetical protein